MVTRTAKRTRATAARAAPHGKNGTRSGARTPLRPGRATAARGGSAATRVEHAPKSEPVSGRFVAPTVRLGMTPHEVRRAAGQPTCILFGPEDHVEWQFGGHGFDPVGSPTLYVTALSFENGRVVRITERMRDQD